MDIETIQNMYNYYDINIEKFSKYFRYDSTIEIKEIFSKNDTEYNKIEIFKNNKKIMIYSWSLLGKYNIKDNIWKWGWSLPISKNQTFFIKKIFDYGYNIIDNNNTTNILKDLLINSIIKINNIDFILALSLYITKNQYINRVDILNNKDEYYFYLIKDIEIL